MQSDLDSRAHWLAVRGHQITVLTTLHPALSEVVTREGVQYHFLRGTKPGRQDAAWRRESKRRFLALHAEDPFDLVIALGGGGWQYVQLRASQPALPPAVMLMQCPLLWNLSSNLKRPSPLNIVRASRSLYYLMCWNRRYGRYLDAVLVLSESSRRAAIAERSFVPDRIHVIPNGVDTDLFRPGAPPERLRRALDLDPEDAIVIWVSRFKREKGWREALGAGAIVAREMSRFRLLLVIAGLGSARGTLMRKVRQLGLTSVVRVIEDIPHCELMDYYRLGKVLLAPLYGPEGQPLVPIEAMACGVPVVGSAIKPLAEILDGGSAGTVVPGFPDPSQFARCILALLRDEAERVTVARRGRERVLECYDERSSAEKTVRILEQIAGDRTATPAPDPSNLTEISA